MAWLFLLAANLLQLLTVLILVDVVISWMSMFGGRRMSRSHPFVRVLRMITDPVQEPFRRLIPPSKLQGIDISPMLAIVVIQIAENILYKAAMGAL